MKLTMPWLRNSDGKLDAVLTFATGAVFTVLFKLFFAGATVAFGEHFKFTVAAPDAATIGAVFLPTLGAYVSNKYVNFNYHPEYVKMRKDIDGDGKEDEVLVVKESK